MSHKSETALYLAVRDQGRMAETCCAEENEINYQIDCFEGFVSEKVREIDKEECLSVKSVFNYTCARRGTKIH